MARGKNVAGMKFGKLTAVERVGIGAYGRSMWLCKCECGNEKIVAVGDLTHGGVKSCGCLKSQSNLSHGMSTTRFYRIWAAMKTRCNNPSQLSYKEYGNRGIRVCEDWEIFNNFKEDMYQSYLEHVEKYGEKETTLDRIDTNGDYCKENCRWATNEEQCNNKRNNVVLDGMTMKQYAKEHGINYSTLRSKVQRERNN